MIQIDHLSKTYGTEAILDDISFSFTRGRISCVAGENGSGKSTLLSIMAGILRPSSGRVTYGDAQTNPQESSLSLLPQQDNLFANLTVRDNIAFWAAAAAGCSLQSPQVQHYLQLFEVHPFLAKKVSVLSGGMRRRAALCAALVSDPEVILLDEPFSGLDILYKEELCNYLQQVCRQGKTIVYTAHNIDEIFSIAQDLILLKHKKLFPIAIPPTLDLLNTALTQHLKGE